MGDPISFVSSFGGAALLFIGGLIVVIVFFMAIGRVLAFVNLVPPNKAYLVFGAGMKSKLDVIRQVVNEKGEKQNKPETVVVDYKIVRGGMVIVWPMIRKVKILDLSLMTLDDVEVKDVLSRDAVKISVDAVAQLKIGSEDNLIATAAEEQLDKRTEEIRDSARQTLQGHLRAIIGLMDASEIYKNRELFAQQVLNVAADDLAGMGLQIVSFVPKELHDSSGYYDALGEPEIQKAKMNARMAKAQADQDATQKEQEAEKRKAAFVKDTNIAKAQFQAEVDTQQAQAKMAGPISEAERNKMLEQKRTEAAEVAAQRREKELEAEIRRPADAERYKIEQQAQANLFKVQKDSEAVKAAGVAQADAEQAKGVAKANVDRAILLADAEGKKAQLLAQAEGTRAQLLAEAEGQQKLADSLNAYGPSALRLELGKKLLGGVPAVAESFSKAFANIDEIRLVEIGAGSNGSDGVGKGLGPVDRFLDTLPNTMFKFLQGATALLGGPIDDIVAAYIADEAKKHGIDVDKDQIAKKVSEKLAEAKEAEAKNETAT